MADTVQMDMAEEGSMERGFCYDLDKETKSIVVKNCDGKGLEQLQSRMSRYLEETNGMLPGLEEVRFEGNSFGKKEVRSVQQFAQLMGPKVEVETGSELDWKSQQNAKSSKTGRSWFKRSRPSMLRLQGGAGGNTANLHTELPTEDSMNAPQPRRRQSTLFKSAVKAMFFVKTIEPRV